MCVFFSIRTSTCFYSYSSLSILFHIPSTSTSPQHHPHPHLILDLDSPTYSHHHLPTSYCGIFGISSHLVHHGYGYASSATPQRDGKTYTAVPMTTDHKPTAPQEKERILNSNGRVERSDLKCQLLESSPILRVST